MVIAVSGRGAGTGYSVLAADIFPCLHLAGAGNAVQCFPRYHYVPTTGEPNLLEDVGDGFERQDAISEATLDAYRSHYQAAITADDLFYYVYGVLQSPEYRTRFAAELGKMLPRLPMTEDFWAFSTAGRRLAELHLHYERVAPWPLEGMPDADSSDDRLRVKKMRWDGTKRGSGLIVNDDIRLHGIPEEAHRYELNGRTALEWIIDRYQVRVDKASRIVNDPNDWAGPRYIVDLVARIVRVSVETVAIVEALPRLGG